MSDVSSGVPSLVAKEKPPINVVGDVTVSVMFYKKKIMILKPPILGKDCSDCG